MNFKSTLIGAVALTIAAPAAATSLKEFGLPETYIPADQRAVEQVFITARAKIRDTPNEIAQDDIATRAANDAKNLMVKQKRLNWVGLMEEVGLTPNGGAYVELVVGDAVELGNM